jgi:hypothetical protein
MKCAESILFTLIFFFTIEAHAILHVEPHLGYTLYGIGENETTPATMIKYHGTQYGLKLGANYLNGIAGLDYNHSSFEQLTSGYKNDFGRNELGLFAGYNFPGVVRAWLTYFFNNTQTANSSSGSIAEGSQYKGHTVELGAGYNGFHPYLSVNFLYRTITLNKYITSTSTTTLTGSDEIRNHEIVLSISAPFNFF